MKSFIISALALLFLLPLCSNAAAQTTSLSSTSSGPAQKLKAGVRFVMQEQFSDGLQLFLMLEPKKFFPVEFRSGLPGTRAPIPKGRVLRLYSTLPEEGKPLPTPIYQGEIPTLAGNKVLGVVSKNKDGKFSIQYINESNLQPGMAYFRNMTNREVMIHITDAPGSEQKQNILPPGQEYIFGKATPIQATTN